MSQITTVSPIKTEGSQRQAEGGRSHVAEAERGLLEYLGLELGKAEGPLWSLLWKHNLPRIDAKFNGNLPQEIGAAPNVHRPTSKQGHGADPGICLHTRVAKVNPYKV